jgi:hypothetical protein
MDDAKATKLVINLKDGIIQAEGGEDFVREVYNDFKEVVSKRTFIPATPAPAAIEQIPSSDDEGEAQRSSAGNAKGKAKRQMGAGNKGSGDAAFKPKFDPDLDLTGIDDFYAKCAPTNNSEKILVFAAFLRDKLGKAICTAHEIYTCYFTMKEDIPTAFAQAFHNCRSRTHYIKYTTMSDIEVTIPGNNWLNAQAKKKAAGE